MGFLDHSTNNIIVDAVLTDLGRKALAEGNFRISQFSLGDDEVDYTIIKKFGRTVGKEKIIKNTPIFEAQTSSTLALKNRLLTIADTTVINMPIVSLGSSTSNVSTQGVITLTQSSTELSKANFTLVQTVNGVSNPAAVFPIDDTFYVEVPHRFIRLLSNTGSEIGGAVIERSSQTAIYTVSSTTRTNSGLPSVTINVGLKGLDDTIFNTFGTTASKNRIDTVISVTGKSTGLRTGLPVVINKTT